MGAASTPMMRPMLDLAPVVILEVPRSHLARLLCKTGSAGGRCQQTWRWHCLAPKGTIINRMDGRHGRATLIDKAGVMQRGNPGLRSPIRKIRALDFFYYGALDFFIGGSRILLCFS